MTDSREELRKRAQADGIEFFFAMFVDMHGKPCAKLVPASSFDMLMDGGAGFAGFAAGPMGQNPADPDLSAVPDPSSYTVVPWEPGLAVLQCDIHVDGEPWPYSPRVILKNQLAKLEARGITAMAGFEAEYMPCSGTTASDTSLPTLMIAPPPVTRYEVSIEGAPFRGPFKAVFTFALPMLLVSNVPVKLLVNKLTSPLELLLLLVLAALIFAASEWLWRTALRRYTSASS